MSKNKKIKTTEEVELQQLDVVDHYRVMSEELRIALYSSIKQLKDSAEPIKNELEQSGEKLAELSDEQLSLFDKRDMIIAQLVDIELELGTVKETLKLISESIINHETSLTDFQLEIEDIQEKLINLTTDKETGKTIQSIENHLRIPINEATKFSKTLMTLLSIVETANHVL